nr:beta-galactosidase [Lachnospiraceae bacterium]
MTVYKFKEYKRSDIKRGHLNLGEKREDGALLDINSLYIERNGKPYIGIMGEYHFVRDNKDNWERELSKIKAGGVGIIATYVFWIYHEETEGKYDFSGDRDLREFIKLCKKTGLEVILRIGPWGHGECRNGGFPDWLVKKPFKKRTDDPDYLLEVKKWYKRIYKEVQGLFYRDMGPIIGIQIENELVDNSKHLNSLKKLAKETGFEAPLWTVTGWNRLYGAEFPVKEFLPVFGAYADAPWADHTEKLPPSKHYTFDPTRNDAAIGMDLINDTDDKGWRLPYEDYPFATCEIGS